METSSQTAIPIVKLRDEYPIEPILKELKDIVIETKDTHPNLAYFAVLYLYVTKSIQINTSNASTLRKFEDDRRMKKLDVIFAKRYIDAYNDWKAGKPISKSWKIAFEFGKNNDQSMIVQHLLLGMNAHINLDLGVATVDATNDNDTDFNNPHFNYIDIIKDFTTINEVLSELTDTVESCLVDCSLYFKLVKLLGKNKEDLIANFSIKYARTGAWYFASFYRKNQTQATIDERDNVVEELAKQIIAPNSKTINTLIRIGAITERKKKQLFIDNMIKKLDEFLKVKFINIEEKHS